MPTMELWMLVLAAIAGLACGFLNTAASSGSAVSLPILIMMGLDPISANATNRIPVLLGALSATASFHSKRVMPWKLALNICIPVATGALGGAMLAELVPGRNLGLIITAAMLIALVLLFSKLKKLIEDAGKDLLVYGSREFVLFFFIGAWLGFIVLDGATYLLLALTLIVGLPLAKANAVKSLAIAASTVVAIALFASHGSIDWKIGGILGVGSIAGGLIGAKIAISESAKRWIFPLLVAIITAELIHLLIHYLHQTH
jgi:uncharacterized membrane protein YfcA